MMAEYQKTLPLKVNAPIEVFALVKIDGALVTPIDYIIGEPAFNEHLNNTISPGVQAFEYIGYYGWQSSDLYVQWWKDRESINVMPTERTPEMIALVKDMVAFATAKLSGVDKTARPKRPKNMEKIKVWL